VQVQGRYAEVDVRGKRLRAAVQDLRVPAHAGSTRQPASKDDKTDARRAGSAGGRPAVHVTVDLQPRSGALGELNLIGNTVDEALDRLDKFMDQATVTDVHELRIVHGHGTGQLRRAVAGYLKEHPLVARTEKAPENQGGGGATIVFLKD
jgi:hypothetical protein